MKLWERIRVCLNQRTQTSSQNSRVFIFSFMAEYSKSTSGDGLGVGDDPFFIFSHDGFDFLFGPDHGFNLGKSKFTGRAQILQREDHANRVRVTFSLCIWTSLNFSALFGLLSLNLLTESNIYIYIYIYIYIGKLN